LTLVIKLLSHDFILYLIIYLFSCGAEREQWKLDFRAVHAKQQSQQRILNSDQAAGVNRQDLDDQLSGLIHPPGIVAQPQPQERSMRVDSILARVQSQGGHTIAVQRDEAIIPQAPEARIPARVARIPAVVSPRPSLYAQQPDDPFLAAILRISEAQASPARAPPSSPPKVPSTQVFLNRKVEQVRYFF
jgi:hypothetical protein